MEQQKKFICLDGDGVLLDYHAGYRKAWLKAFGEVLEDVEPLQYHAARRFGARRLDKAELNHLHSVGFDSETWYSMPLLPGAREACELLQAHGIRLEVVSALPPKHELARLHGLQDRGVCVDRVHAVGGEMYVEGVNPKLATLQTLLPDAMVDDYLFFLQGVTAPTRRVFIDSSRAGSPNAAFGGPPPDETHGSLLAFAKSWVATHKNNP